LSCARSDSLYSRIFIDRAFYRCEHIHGATGVTGLLVGGVNLNPHPLKTERVRHPTTSLVLTTVRATQKARTAWRVLQRRRFCDAGAGGDTEAVAAAEQAVGEGAASR
jgi:hypothetical protein